MKYKCIIVDDEPPTIKILKNYIETLENLEIIGICKNALQATDILTKEKIDLMFLDVKIPQLPDIQSAKTIQHLPKVIFTTTDKNYGREKTDPDVVDYLPKPVSYERFLKAVVRFCHTNKAETVNTEDGIPGFLYFRADRKMVKVILDDITYIESLKDYIVIHRQNNSDLKVKYTISNVENMLPQNLFLRIHRSFIVSINKVTAFTNHDVEIGKTELPIGRSYSFIFRKLTHDNSAVIPTDDLANY